MPSLHRFYAGGIATKNEEKNCKKKKKINGAQNYSHKYVEIIENSVEEHEQLSENDWRSVSKTFHRYIAGSDSPSIDLEYLKTNFDLLESVKKRTGHLLVLRLC